MKKTVNSSYMVGALSSALFSSGTPGDLQSFFDKRMMSEDTSTPDIKPAAAAATEAAETKTAPGVDAPDPIPEGALRRIKTKKSRTVPDDASDGEEEDTENGQYSGPSRKFRVMMEDGKKDRTPLDPEREARTVFVGNLPVKLDAKALKRKVRRRRQRPWHSYSYLWYFMFKVTKISFVVFFFRSVPVQSVRRGGGGAVQGGRQAGLEDHQEGGRHHQKVPRRSAQHHRLRQVQGEI